MKASISLLSALSASFAIPSTNSMNSSFLATKSVSELTSTTAAVLPSSERAILTRPIAAILPAFLAAFDSPFSLRISTALLRSPSASTKAFLQSIIPAPVISRSSFTSDAVIAAIVFLLILLRPWCLLPQLQFLPLLRSPLQELRRRTRPACLR